MVFEDYINDLTLKLFPSGFLLNKNNTLQETIRYNMSYNITMDLYNPSTIEFSDKTLKYKDQLDKNIVSTHMFINKASIKYMYSRSVQNYSLIKLDTFKDILKELNCTNFLDLVNKVTAKNNGFISFLLTKFMLLDQKKIESLVPYKELEAVTNYYVDSFEKFWDVYDLYIRSLIDDYINAFAKELYNNFDNTNVCSLVNPIQIGMDCMVNDNLSHFIKHKNYGVSCAYNSIYNYTKYKDFIDKIINIYKLYSDYDNTLSNIDALKAYMTYNSNPMSLGGVCGCTLAQTKFLLKNAQKSLKKSVSYRELKNIFFYMYTAMHPVSPTQYDKDEDSILITPPFKIFGNDTTLLEFDTTSLCELPYIPLLLGIEYDNHLYKIAISTNRIHKYDNTLSNLAYFNSNNVKILQCNSNHAIEINNVGYITANEILEKYTNFNKFQYDLKTYSILEDMISSDSNDYNKDFKYKPIFYNMTNLSNCSWDWSLFYQKLYYRIVEVIWVYFLFKYNNSSIKDSLEEFLSKEALLTVNDELKEVLEEDIDRYNLNVGTVATLDCLNHVNHQMANNIASNINFVNIIDYYVSELLSNDITNSEYDNDSDINLNLVVVTLVNDLDDRYMSLYDLISLNSNHHRVTAYNFYYEHSNEYIVANPYYVHNNRSLINSKKNNVLRKKLFKIIYSNVDKNYLVYLINKVYNYILQDICKQLKFYNYKDVDTFKDLSTQLTFYTNNTNFYCKYY